MVFYERVIIPIVFGAAALSFWVVWLPMAATALRTGRLLGRGRVYDRTSNPKMYWFGLGFMLFTGLMMTFGAIVLATGPRWPF